MSKFLLKAHQFYVKPLAQLQAHLIDLKKRLGREEYLQHPDVKFACRLRKATFDVIPQDPTCSEYRLKGNLKRFRRYKRGLKRYRLFFCFSSKPCVIVYLYVNDRSSLRKEGSKRDPYSVFSGFVERGEVAPDPADPKMQAWLADYRQSEDLSFTHGFS